MQRKNIVENVAWETDRLKHMDDVCQYKTEFLDQKIYYQMSDRFRLTFMSIIPVNKDTDYA